MTFKEYFGDWLEVFNKNEFNKIIQILNTLYKSKSIVPEYKDVFKAFTLCNRKDCKVVFLGQDPYPQKGVATGILFGNKESTQELSPSLEIIKEAVINYEIPHSIINFDITLQSWAKQGILMLNSALTCELNKVGSHTMLWRPFISKFLQALSNSSFGIVYVLFGEQAKTFEPYINKRTNTIIKVQHPAYFARTHTKMPYALFKDINRIMKEKYNTYIEWYK